MKAGGGEIEEQRGDRQRRSACIRPKGAFFRLTMAGSGSGDGRNPRLCSGKRTARGFHKRRCQIQSRTSGPWRSRPNAIWEIPTKKSFQKQLGENPRCHTVYLASCFTDAIIDQINADGQVRDWFNLTSILCDERQRNVFLERIFYLVRTPSR